MIRNMRVGEAEAVAQMSRRLAEHHGDTGTLEAGALARLVAQGWLQVLVAEEAGALVGYAALVRKVKTHEGARGLHVDNLYVQRAARGRGVGRALMDAAAQLARAQGCAALTVGAADANAEAQAFYTAGGFAEAPRTGRAYALAL
ncbi:MAG: GNAT family N-acetyltransferase [Pseudomonadota bacterium]